MVNSLSGEDFGKALENDFKKDFPYKKIAPQGSLLAKNLEYVLKRLKGHSRKFPTKRRIKNVVLYFYDENISKKIKRVTSKKGVDFQIVNIDYSDDIIGKFINLE